MWKISGAILIHAGITGVGFDSVGRTSGPVVFGIIAAVLGITVFFLSHSIYDNQSAS